MAPARNHRHPDVVEAARLHRARFRRERGQSLLEGPNLVEAARHAGVTIDALFALEGNEEENATDVDGRALARLAGTKTPRGPIAVFTIPAQREPDRSLNWLVSVGVSDPGNLGTLVRTAAAFGWVFGYTHGSADPWSPKCLRAGAGGQFQTPVIQIDQPPEWLTAVAMVVRGGDPIETVETGPVALLIGEEASGLPDKTVEAADNRVTIATPGPTESLNAGVLAGIAVHELARRSTH